MDVSGAECTSCQLNSRSPVRAQNPYTLATCCTKSTCDEGCSKTSVLLYGVSHFNVSLIKLMVSGQPFHQSKLRFDNGNPKRLVSLTLLN
jgi:hypothetical protein